MLQNIRDKTGSKLAFLIMLPLLVIFAFFGINSYFVASVDNSVAKVGKLEISETKYRTRLQQQRNQMQQMFGESYNARMTDTPEFKRNVLDRLIDEELMLAAAENAGMTVSATRLRDEIKKNVPAAFLGDKFDPEVYAQILSNASYTPQMFEELLVKGAITSQLEQRVFSDVSITDADAKRYLALNNETRDFRYVLLNRPTLAADAVSEDEIKKYFDSHKADFNNEETVAIEYVELNQANMPLPSAPDEATLLDTYQREVTRFGTVEGRLTSHILVQVAESASADDVKKAQDKANALLAEIRGGKDFAEVAKSGSDDIGSKEAGGDLGYIERPDPNSPMQVFEPAFIDALFGLEVGKVSEPVKTAQGFHLIQLREIRPAAIKPFEEVRSQLEQEAIQQARDDEFADLEGAMLDAAAVAVGTLDEVAKAVKGTVQQVPAFPKGMAFGVASNPDVQEFVFSDTGKSEGAVSDVIELSPTQMVVVRVTDYKPKSAKTLDEARSEIVVKLTQEKTDAKAKEEADAAFKRLQAGEALDAIATSVGATVADATAVGRQSVAHDASMVKEVFKLAKPAAADKPVTALSKLADGRYGLVVLTAVKPGDVATVDQATLDSTKESLKGQLGSTDAQAFRAALRDGIEITIDETKL
ncbi:hypothetical protein C7S18_16905 [Ahniella affigens]|uniref:Periplasmic chaperone PpiD n=1 Tax=Ahniella affigens TaxID=2021234 RepID=A0A2P1PV75_9GAMM|nr:SurA N-terminal domain-containing protein [Ahniella affigens]AVP98765.1 hypothetical protein C7S18_16905 [Ahniella affigens]